MSEQVLPTQFKIHVEGDRAIKCRQRFIDAFNATWSRLPVHDIELITIGIAQTKSKVVEIRLMDEHYSMSRGPTGDASAQFRYYLDDAEITYLSLYASKLPDALLQLWIAHEIAHLFLQMTDEKHGENYSVAEEEVLSVMVKRWGFSQSDEEETNAKVFFITQENRSKGLLRKRR